MSDEAKMDLATERILACIDDEELAARYPSRAHFISADNPHQGKLAIDAIREGDPVVIVYHDGYELLIRPERGSGSAEFPSGVQVETRDANGKPVSMDEVVDAIPTAWERTQEGLTQAARGEGTPLDNLL